MIRPSLLIFTFLLATASLGGDASPSCDPKVESQKDDNDNTKYVTLSEMTYINKKKTKLQAKALFPDGHIEWLIITEPAIDAALEKESLPTIPTTGMKLECSKCWVTLIEIPPNYQGYKGNHKLDVCPNCNEELELQDVETGVTISPSTLLKAVKRLYKKRRSSYTSNT